ncbi:MAG: phosphotransferase [Candidatus Hydrogenedens sp.]|nr:phosphotransferase [Candidatus Hydrogenedens sp.]
MSERADTPATPKLGGLDIIREVIRQYYDLGEIGQPEQLPAAHQRRHRKMMVQTTAGRYLIKTYKRDPVGLDSLRFQHRLSDHFAAHDIPVARIQRAKDGRSIVEIDTWAMELQHFMPGGTMPLNAETLGVSASVLGKIHEVCRDVPVPPRDAQKWRFSEVPRDLFRRLFELAARETEAAKLKEPCDNIGKFLLDAGDALSEAKRDAFETGLIHGDWHGGNLMFDGNTLTAVVDLEFAGDGCFLEDIAYGMSNLCVRTTTEEEKLQLRTDILLEKYQKFRTLSYAEEVALYYAVGVKHIATVCYQSLQAGGRIAGYTPSQWVHILAHQARWLAEQSRRARWGE